MCLSRSPSSRPNRHQNLQGANRILRSPSEVRGLRTDNTCGAEVFRKAARPQKPLPHTSSPPHTLVCTGTIGWTRFCGSPSGFPIALESQQSFRYFLASPKRSADRGREGRRPKDLLCGQEEEEPRVISETFNRGTDGQMDADDWGSAA